jgi:hypothetical protein
VFKISLIKNFCAPVRIVFVTKRLFKFFYSEAITNVEFYFVFLSLFDCLKSLRRTKLSFDLFPLKGVILIELCLSLKFYSSNKSCNISIHLLLFLASNCILILLFEVRLNLSSISDLSSFYVWYI